MTVETVTLVTVVRVVTEETVDTVVTVVTAYVLMYTSEFMNLITRVHFTNVIYQVVRDRLTSGPGNASPIIHNELLCTMGTMVQSIICSKIQEAGLFSILVEMRARTVQRRNSYHLF